MFLPSIDGSHKVATSSWKATVPKKTFGVARHKTNNRPAFQMEEIAFQIYYPCDPETKGLAWGYSWLSRPLSQWVDGYAKFTGTSRWIFSPLVYLLGPILKIPAYNDAPLKAPQTDEGWPLIFFSHGLAGTSKTYSQLCGKLAAEGNVVIAMEHRDGTGPVTIHPVDGVASTHLYLKVDELELGDVSQEPVTPMPLRTEQLKMRHVEILEAFKAFKHLVNGDNNVFSSERHYNGWESWRGRVNTRTMTFAGHSFGGCTGIHLLTCPTPDSYEPLPITKAVIHDPWMEPFSGNFVDEVVKGNAAFSIPALIINSETFTLWRGHFPHQVKLLNPWIKQAGRDSALITLVRSKHMDYSDFPVLYPFWFKKPGMAFHETYHGLTMAFLDERLESYLESQKGRVIRNLIVDNAEDDKLKSIQGNHGDILVHESTEDAAIKSSL